MATKIVNIKTFTYDSAAYLGMLTVTYEDGIDDTVDNKFDNDLAATDGIAVNASTTGTITASDPFAFKAIAKGSKAVMVFTGSAVDGGADVTTTITDAMMLKASVSQEHAADGSYSLTFKAYWADGQTSPVVMTQI